MGVVGPDTGVAIRLQFHADGKLVSLYLPDTALKSSHLSFGANDVLDVMARLREHTTIFYSTHILDDVQRASDTVAILNQGHIVASGPIENILKGKEGTVYTISVKGSQETVEQNLSQLPWVTYTTRTQQNGSCTWQVGVSDETTAEASLLRHLLSDPDAVVTDFSRKKYELEEIFMKIVKGDEYDC